MLLLVPPGVYPAMRSRSSCALPSTGRGWRWPEWLEFWGALVPKVYSDKVEPVPSSAVTIPCPAWRSVVVALAMLMEEDRSKTMATRSPDSQEGASRLLARDTCHQANEPAWFDVPTMKSFVDR